MNAHNMSANIPQLFRTYQSRELPLDCKIWEAARATSATPALFERIEIGRAQPFIDGGMGHNNPSRLVLEEANALFPSRKLGCLVSIGTGQAGVISVEEPKAMIDTLKKIVTDCEATHETMRRLFTNFPDAYFRLNVDQGMQGIELSQLEKLSIVEAHTKQYMKKNEVQKNIDSMVNSIRVPKAQLLIKQLSTAMSLMRV
jgi:hypothetical protein